MKTVINLAENTMRVLEKRYLKKDEDGKVIETPQNMFRRVAKTIAGAERQYKSRADIKKIEEEFYQMMSSLEFLPNSPTLMNAGRELKQLSGCFVLPVNDSIENIFEAVKQSVLIHKLGGGTGFDFSKLRPKNSAVKTTAGIASGPVSFMAVFDAATEAIKQGGVRRGANMGILRIDHPDIMEFITCKTKENKFNNFNISVAMTDDFMEKLKSGSEYDLIDPHTKKITGRRNAADVFDLIANMAWQTGDPGIIFIDRINKHNPTPHIGKIEATNPCGEMPLLAWESCNLGSINLAKMVNNSDIDYEKLERVTKLAVRFLDNVIDVNSFPLEQVREITRANRKIGLGVMGFADMLILLNIPYNSEEAIQVAEKVMKFILEKSKASSSELAEQRGSFPNYKGSVYDTGNSMKMRNATTTTIAPTGSISIIAGCSSGIEPLFGVTYTRTVMDNEKLVEVNPVFGKTARERGFYSKELMKEIAERGTVKGISIIPEEIQRLFVTAHDISPEWHIKMQAAFQKYVDNSVSKTVNLRHDAAPQDFKQVFRLAYELSCKGITAFRDGCKSEQVISFRNQTKYVIPRPREKETSGITKKHRTGCGNLYITINRDDKGPCEVFSNTGRGGCPSQSEAASRVLSIALRAGVNPKALVDQLKGIRCLSCVRNNKDVEVLSCPDAIGRVLENCIENINGPNNLTFEHSKKCPVCGHEFEYVGAKCYVCRNCGESKC